MNKSEFISSISKVKVNKDRVETISKVYNADLSDTVAKMVSFADQVDFFDEERRALSYAEIFNPKKNIGIDFPELKLIPLIDAYDCTYIVYSIKDKKWAKYNTVDNILFKKKASIEEVI